MLARYLRLEMVFDLLLTALGLAIALEATVLGFGTMTRPGPGFYPFVVGLWILVLGLILLFFSRNASSKPLFASRLDVVRFWAVVACLIAWLMLLNSLGFILATFVVTVVFSKLMRLRGWVRPLILAAGTALAMYLLFNVWFYTDLPRGILG